MAILDVELAESLPKTDVIDQIRNFEPLREMAQWIQQTHRMIELDSYGTGYMHASPRITRAGRLELQYQSKSGLEALRLMEADLSQLQSADHPVLAATPTWVTILDGRPSRDAEPRVPPRCHS